MGCLYKFSLLIIFGLIFGCTIIKDQFRNNPNSDLLINFSSNLLVITPDDYGMIDALIKKSKLSNSYDITINGYFCVSNEQTKFLARQRVKFIKKILTDRGLDDGNIVTFIVEKNRFSSKELKIDCKYSVEVIGDLKD